MNLRHRISHWRLFPAHWPKLLTASGTTVSRPSCLSTPAHQLTWGGNCCLNRPIESPARYASVSSQIGGLTSFDFFSGVLGNEFRASSEHPTESIGSSYLRGHFPRTNDRQDSTFPRESAERVAFAIFPLFFRVSGTLQVALARGSLTHRICS